MFRKQGVIALLGIGVAAAWPIASEALTCDTTNPPPRYNHKITFTSSGTYLHSCVLVTSGSVLFDLLSVDDPGTVIATLHPQGCISDGEGGWIPTDGAGPCNDDGFVAGQVQAYSLCRHKAGQFPSGINPRSVPAFFDVLANSKSTTTKRTGLDDPAFVGEDPAIQFRTTLLVTPPPIQLARLKTYCPGGVTGPYTVVNYLPIAFQGTLNFVARGLSVDLDLNATGGDCTIDPAAVTFHPSGVFNIIPYEGGCGSLNEEQEPK